MKVIKDSINVLEDENLKYEYSYKIIETKFNKHTLFGIEVERVDYIKGKMVNIEREVIDKISDELVKVERLHKLALDNLVSPIHLIDVLGQYADKYIEEMEEERAVVYS